MSRRVPAHPSLNVHLVSREAGDLENPGDTRCQGRTRLELQMFPGVIRLMDIPVPDILVLSDRRPVGPIAPVGGCRRPRAEQSAAISAKG